MSCTEKCRGTGPRPRHHSSNSMGDNVPSTYGLNSSNFISISFAMTDGQSTCESVELPSYQPVGASVMSVPENEDLIMDNARQAAAAGFIRPESIPLLALTDESFYHRKLSWTLRFPVPPPDTSGSVRRFSSTVTFRQGPHSAEALEGALRLAASFSYSNDASPCSLQLPFLASP